MPPTGPIARLPRLVLAGALMLAIMALLLRRPTVAHGPIAFEEIDLDTPAERLSVPGLTFTSSPPNALRVMRPGIFSTLNGNLLMARGAAPLSLSIRFAEPQTAYSFRFATSAPASLTVDGVLGGAAVFAHRFSGVLPPGGTYPEGIALGRGSPFDTLTIGVEDGSAAFTLDDLDWGPIERVNGDIDAPVAIYCQAGGIEVYKMAVDGAGRLAIHISDRDLDAVAVLPPENTIVAAFEDVLLSRLTTGEYQVNAGPDSANMMYVFIWDACPPTRAYDKSFNLSSASSR